MVKKFLAAMLLAVFAALPAMAATYDQNLPLSDSNRLPVDAAIGASSGAGGVTSTARMASAGASTNGTLVKASAGRVYSVQGINNASYAVFLVLYDAVTNPPVPGTTVIRKKIAIPAGPNLGFTFDFPAGLYFATGIGFAFTKLVADADTTALTAADVTAFNVDYY